MISVRCSSLVVGIPCFVVLVAFVGFLLDHNFAGVRDIEPWGLELVDFGDREVAPVAEDPSFAVGVH